MPKRAWEVPAENELPDGWTPDSGQPVAIVEGDSENELDDALTVELLNAGWVLKRFGGVISAAADREELAPGIWVTRRYLILWESYAPGRKRQTAGEPPTQAQTAEAAPVAETAANQQVQEAAADPLAHEAVGGDHVVPDPEEPDPYVEAAEAREAEFAETRG